MLHQLLPGIFREKGFQSAFAAMVRLFAFLWFLTVPAVSFGAFSLTSSGGFYKVDTNAGLVFKVNQSNGDISSLVYNGTEYQYSAKGSHINSGLGSTGVTVTGTTVGTDYIKITVTAPASTAGGTLTHYYMARKGFSHIYMATHFTQEPDIGLVRFIVRIPNSLLPNGPTPSEIYKTDSTIEASDIFAFSSASTYTALIGQTRSKHYSGQRLKDWTYTGATGTNVAAWMVRSPQEGGSGGPFYRSLINQCGDQQELYEILNYGEGQTEAFRFNILNGPYTLVFTNGGAPPALDTSWIGDMGLVGYVAPADRGTVTSTGISNRDTNYGYTVGFANSAAQCWTSASAADGSFTKTDILPGTYTMTVYKNELSVYTASVTVTAGATTTVSPITIAADPSTTVPLWRIGNWDGTPAEFLNGDKVTTMHPSDIRMANWSPGPYVVGTSTPATGMPCYQWKDIAGGSQTIQFNLTASQIASSTVRVGMTCSNAGARPNIGVNSWTAGLQGASTQPSSRTLTVGTYRGNNVTYTFSVPASALVVGTNSLYLYPISGSSSTSPYLSPGYSLDCVELYQGTAQTLAVAAPPSPVTADGGDTKVTLNWAAVSGAASYNVSRATVSGGPYTLVSSAQTAASFIDTGRTNTTTYYYVVSSNNSSGTGINSDEVSGTAAAPTPPVAPTGLSATSYNASVALTWNTSFSATGYKVKRSTTSGSGYVTVKSVVANNCSDFGLVNGTTYYYVVFAENADGESASSAEVSATPSATATVTLGNLAANYDGASKPVSVTTSPAGVPVVITYDGSSAVPVNPGTYAIVATVSDPNYTGSASGNLVISRVPISITWTGATDFNWNSATPNWSLAGNVIYQSGDSVSFTDAGNAASPVNLVSDVQPAAVTVNAAKNYILSGPGVISGTATLSKSGNGTLILNTAHTFSGATTISGGILQIGDGGTTGSIASTSGITDNATLAFSRSNLLTVSNAISGSGGLVKSGAGEVVLTASNSYTGTTNVNAGKLSVGSGSTTTGLGSGGVVLTGGTTFRLNSSSAQTISNAITLSGLNANATLTVGSISSGFNGTISGTADQTLTASGTTQMSFGANTQQLSGFAGTVDILSGATVRFSTTTTTANVGGAGTTFNVNGFLTARNAIGGAGGIHLGALSGSGFILGGGAATVGTDIWIVGEKNMDSAFSGSIANGSGANASVSALTKLGTGALTLSGTSNYTGNTTITAGKLLVNGSLGTTATTVATAGTLGGTGSIAGAVTCNGILAPGVTSGALTLSGGLTLASTSTLNYDLGTTSDLVAVSGNLTLDGTVNVTAAAGFGGGTYTLMTYTGTLTNNTLTVGTLPATCTAVIDLTTAGQVKLIVTSTNTAPQITSGPTASANPVITTQANLSVTAADDGGEGNLTYTWSATGPAAVVFSANSTNAAKNATVTFTAPGSYTLTVTATDSIAATVSNFTSVTVTATPASITVGSSSATLAVNASQTFTATVRDQFGNAVNNPSVAWSTNGGGTINASGLFSATTAGGPYQITATSGSLSSGAPVTITKAAATVTLSNLAATYDGTAKSASTSTTPSGLNLVVTYDGSATSPTAPGKYAVSAVTNDPNYAGSTSGTLVIAQRSLESWQTSRFTAAQIAAGEAAPDADPDHDGLTNLAEYALGGEPYAFTPQPVVTSDGITQSIIFQRPAWIGDVLYHAQTGSDFTTWSELPLEVLNPGSDPETVRVTRNLATHKPDKIFLRLMFSK
ncbi:MAG: rhamnogalacturonan lyase B N-terminal domain-containing protein [Luteolibacter sp.]